ncbi:biopolymer transporter ExbD [Polynucleobacter sp. es-MAR-4]|uniref:ExbD/TolR family protein n=1 Tax=Polynucleobacter sp. es-MAR-4 TaxID=1855655 RepID=UPI001C0A96DE|nr:biopolymer transporter ExbD [Polynucleobacter sp. es-MAR-4]MBU3637943.1 biopolymer transporter ExbD [Polynucleobacter sp. es-MAR-4]
MLVRGGGDDSGLMAEMNVTPLVDVMLVLLIVFMVTAPLLIPQSLGVNLPKTESIQSPVEKDLTKLIIKADGTLELDGKAINDQALKSALVSKANEPKFQLQVDADENLKYSRLAQVIAMAQGAGVTKLALVTVAKNK